MTARERRVLIAGAAIAAAVLVLRLAPPAVRSVQQQHERLAVQAALLARSQDDLRQAGALVDSGVVLQAAVRALAPKILTGSSRAEALADLAGRLSATAGRHRVKVSRTDLLPDSMRAGGLRLVRLRASLESDSRGTMELLAALAGEEVVLPVSDLRIMALDPTSPDAAAEVVRTELTVEGWFVQHQARP